MKKIDFKGTTCMITLSRMSVAMDGWMGYSIAYVKSFLASLMRIACNIVSEIASK
jgi:hypothetical protein